MTKNRTVMVVGVPLVVGTVVLSVLWRTYVADTPRWGGRATSDRAVAVVGAEIPEAGVAKVGVAASSVTPSAAGELVLYSSADDPRLLKLKEVLEKVNINTLTPVEALMKLDELRKLL